MTENGVSSEEEYTGIVQQRNKTVAPGVPTKPAGQTDAVSGYLKNKRKVTKALDEVFEPPKVK